MAAETSRAISFVKMEGAGNDFVVLAGDLAGLEPTPGLVTSLCDRRTGVGGDGLVEMRRSQAGEDAIEVYCFNSDGSPVTTCLNAFRCAALRAFELGWTGAHLVLQTARGEVEAHCDGDRVELGLKPPDLHSRHVVPPGAPPLARASLVSLGDLHLVVLLPIESLSGADFPAAARPLRHWTGASTTGANVHFVFPRGDKYAIRSFERGVEEETMACGSGCVAATCVLNDRHPNLLSLDFHTHGGHMLTVSVGSPRWSMCGPARTAFTGVWSRAHELPPLGVRGRR